MEEKSLICRYLDIVDSLLDSIPALDPGPGEPSMGGIYPKPQDKSPMGGPSEESSVPANMSVTVPVSVVHKALRNILKNELNFDVKNFTSEAMKAANEAVARQVDQYLKGSGYDQAALEHRVQNYINHVLKPDMERMVRDAVQRRVDAIMQEHGFKIVEAVVSQGIKVNLGWNHTIKIRADISEENPKSS